MEEKALLSLLMGAQWGSGLTLVAASGQYSLASSCAFLLRGFRAPAAWSGLYGFKPSVARMPHSGLMGSQAGMDNIVGVLGPLATSARDLELFCRVMLQYEPWLLEAPLLHMPWREDVANGKGLPKRLSIAIMWDDTVVAPHPPIQAALEDAKAKLIEAGHEILDWEPLDHHFEVWKLIVRRTPSPSMMTS